MVQEGKKFYLTTTIPYVNAKPHLGHALEFVQADAIVRFYRHRGANVYFLSGTDENAIKNVRAAEEEGTPVAEFVDRNAAAFQELLKKLNVSIDQFIRTTEAPHIIGAQALWQATDPKDIYKKKYKGLYCLGCEFFYKPQELDEHGHCPEHPNLKLEKVEEENYFFRLSRYQDWLYRVIENDQLRIIPSGRKNEILAFIAGGLEDFSISRPIERTKGWGVPVPNDSAQTMYVWYDALANYITALGYPDEVDTRYREFWLENPMKVHLLGKGVAKFHAIYWPAMLKSAGLPLPNLELVHGYITINGQKMSKSIGNIVDPAALVERYGADAVRYYLLREIATAEDGDFSEQRFIDRYNGDLANGLGNFAARVLTLGEKEKKVAFNFTKDLDKSVLAKIDESNLTVRECVRDYRLHQALAVIWDLIAFGNRYLNEKKPWSLDQDVGIIDHGVFNVIYILEHVTKLLRPFLPATAETISKSIHWQEGHLIVSRAANLFPRLK